jgi:hypothetical protein
LSAYPARSSSAPYLFGDLGLGAGLRVWRTLGLFAAADAAFTLFKRPVVNFRTSTRSTQQPLLAFSLGVEFSI